ncbi:MAG: hypothetical protein IPK94_05630 [Saprospiraceae bacterium]|nr:hypothetical protein [Saprospiraceae bacterium]
MMMDALPIRCRSGDLSRDKISPEYQRIYQVDWMDDKTLLLNARQMHWSDLYLYLPLTRESKRLTQDFYDDLNASLVHSSAKKVSCSNPIGL